MVVFFKNQFSFYKNFIPSIVIYCFFIIWVYFYSLSNSVDLPTFHLDGAFQTASGLFRLDSGQFPGKNFFPYLGVGPVFILYPMFKAFGANLGASVFSAHFVTLVLGGFSASVLWHLIFRQKSFLTSIAAGSALFIAPLVINGLFHLSLSPPLGFAYDIGFAYDPGNSLRPIRSVAPYLMVAIYFLVLVRINSAQLRYSIAGVVTGIILLWSNDFAIPSAGMFALFVLWKAHVESELTYKHAFLYFLFMVLSLAIFLALVTIGHPLEFLKYNFLDVAKDQWWYFGPYDERSRIFGLDQVGRLFDHGNIAVLFIVAFLFFYGVMAKSSEYVLVAWIGLVLFLGGSLASIGGHVGGYFGGFHFLGGAVTVIIGLKILYVGLEKLFFKKLIFVVVLRRLITLIVLVALLAAAISEWGLYNRNVYDAKNDHGRFYVPELGGYLKTSWKTYVDIIRREHSDRVLEEYWGIWSAFRHIDSAWPVDSVISALGGMRSIAKGKIPDADIVITTRYPTSSIWQPWSLTQNYWFYETLLRNWSPSASSPTTIVWRKSEHARQFKDVDCSVGTMKQSLVLQSQEPGFFEVEINYEFNGSYRHLLMVESNISTAANSGGYVSVDPNARSVKLPVYVKKAGATILKIRVIGNADYDLNITSCSAKSIPKISDDVLHVPPSFDEYFYLTDSNWIHGIARRWAGFFVPNQQKFVDEYKAGRFVKFADGHSREIIRTVPSELYLNIYLNGEPLDPERVGLPARFIVMDKAGDNTKQGGR